MTIDFQIKALPVTEFQSYFKLSDRQLSEFNAKRIIVDANPGYPCRVSLKDAEIGESVIAISYCFHNVKSPYKATGPIFIREKAETATLSVNEVPKMLLHRLLSIRAYDSANLIVAADIVEGVELKKAISQYFSNSAINYLHIHNAKPGCFNCAAYRA